jgi:pseudouridine synthase
MKERVQKILREWGIASRREAERMILEGRIKINGQLIKLGEQADKQKDIISVDGKVLTNRPDLYYILLHKPQNFICTCYDPQNRQTVLDLLAPELKSGLGIHPVGRLDRNSTGALLLTNDGQLTLNLTHPRYHLSKTYEVWVKGYPPEAILQKWREGIVWEGKKTLPAHIEVLNPKTTKTCLKIVINEGRNRQIRKIADFFGFPVIRLHRIAIGSIKLSSLACGKYRFLKDWEVKMLMKK